MRHSRGALLTAIAVGLVALASGAAHAQAPPAIVSVTADDPDESLFGYDVGDTITVVFDINTNESAAVTGTKSGTDMNALFTLDNGHTFGDGTDSYTVSWSSATTLLVTVSVLSTSSIRIADTLTLQAAADIQDSGATSGPSTDAGQVIGDWGRAFVTTWQTDNVGTSNDDQIAIKLVDTGYDFQVDWGDGTASAHDDASVPTVPAGVSYVTHTYPAPGTYTVTILGTFPRRASGDDKLKLLTVDQWGDIALDSAVSAFSGCANLTLTATDAPDLSNVQDCYRMFRNATSFNGDIGGWDVSNVTEMNEMFREAYAFNQDISGWDVSNVFNMRGMFYDAYSFNQDIGGWVTSSLTSTQEMFKGAWAFNQDIGGWDVSGVTTMEQMFKYAYSFDQDLGAWDVTGSSDFSEFLFVGTALSTSNYDALLIGWGAQSVQMFKTFDAGDARYTPGGAAEAGRSNLQSRSWTINDGGPVAGRTWDGSTSGAWNTATNWTGDTQPSTNDLVIFDSTSTANLSTTNDIAGLSNIDMRVVDPAGAVTVAGNAISLGNAGIDMANATQDLTFSANLTVASASNWSVAAGRVLTVSGDLALAANLTKTYAGELCIMGAGSGIGTLNVTTGTLRGTGSLAGPLVVQGTGSVAPGTLGSRGILSGSSTAELNSDSTLSIRIADYTTAGTDYDRLALTGALTLSASGVLELDLAGLSSTGTATGIVTCSGTPTGTFATVNVSNNTNSYDVSVEYVAGGVNVTMSPGSNASPVLADLSASATFFENTVNSTPQILDGTVTLTDGDSPDFDTGTLTVSGLNGTETVSVNNMTNGLDNIRRVGNDIEADTSGSGTWAVMGTVGGAGSTGVGEQLVITFNATSTPTRVDRLIENLNYASSSETGETAHDLTVTVTDGDSGSTGGDVINVTVTAENDPTDITESSPQAVTMDEDSMPVAFSLTLNATDVDGDAINWEISTIATNGTAGASGTGASKAITYTPNGNYDGADSFIVRAYDGAGGEDFVTINVTIDPRNDIPQITVAPTVTGTHIVGQTLTANAGTWNDTLDNPAGTISLTYQWRRADDAIGTGAADIAGEVGTTYTLQGTDSDKYVCVVETATDDGEGLPATQSDSVATAWSQAGNAPPSILLPGSPVTYVENDPATPIDVSADVQDAESSYNGGSLAVQITTNSEADDRISVIDGVAGITIVSTTEIHYVGSQIGTVVASEVTGSNVLTITFTTAAADNDLAVSALASAVGYHSVSENPSTLQREVTFTITDAGGGVDSDTQLINVTAEDDAPTVAVNTGVTVLQGGSVTIGNGELQITDDEQAAAALVLTLSVEPTTGTLYNGAMPLVATDTFTQADIDASLIAYTHGNVGTAPDSFTFTVSDGAGGVIGATVFAITVTDVNDAPLLDDTAFPTLSAIYEDIAAGANAGSSVAEIIVDGSITDPDGATVESIALVGADETNGQWEYDTGGGWTSIDSATLAETSAILLDATSLLRFVPDADFNGSSELTFRAWDESSGAAGDTAVDTSASGGTTAFSTAADALTVAVDAVPDINGFTADDPNDLDAVYSVGDTITITFDEATNESTLVTGVLTGAELNTLLVLSGAATWGNTVDRYWLTWVDDVTLEINVTGIGTATVALGDEVTIAAAANIIADTASIATTGTTGPLAGDWGIIAPMIVSVVADDPDDGDAELSAGDTITVMFDTPTNAGGSALTGMLLGTELDALLRLSSLHSFGGAAGAYTLSWPDAVTLLITIDALGAATVDLGDTVQLLPAAGLTNAALTSAASTDISDAMAGDWGHGGAPHLMFTVEPTDIVAGDDFAPAIVVDVVDDTGALDLGFAGDVTLSFIASGGATFLPGATATATATVSGGQATFTTLSVDVAGGGYRLVATATDRQDATSAAFSVTAGAATALAFTTEPAHVYAGNPFAAVVSYVDAYGNVDTSASGTVSLSIATDGAGGGTTLGGTLSRAPAAGVVSFTGLTLDQAGAGFALNADDTVFTVDGSAFDVVAPVSVTLAAPGGPHVVGTAVTIDVTISDGAPAYEFTLDFDDGTPYYVEVDNATGSASIEHTFSASGTYDVTVDVVDALSGTATFTLPVTVNDDVTGPVITVASPADGSTVYQDYVTIVGTTDEPVAWLTAGGVTATLDADRTAWHATISTPVATTYNWSIVAEDDLGNQTTLAYSITVELPTLTVEIVEPTQSTAIIGSDIQFEATATGGIGPYQFDWDFGDGGSDTGQSVLHPYGATGYYLVSLVVDDLGSAFVGSQSAVLELEVTLPSIAAHFTYTPVAVAVGYRIDFDASASVGTIRYYHWDLDGDGMLDGYSTSPRVFRVYTTVGAYPVLVMVEDIYGQRAATTTIVPVGESRRDARLDVAARTITVLARPGTTDIVSTPIEVANIGLAGSIAAVRFDAPDMPAFATITPAEGLGLSSGATGALMINVDPSGQPYDLHEKTTVRVVLTAEGSNDAPLPVDVTIEFRPYGAVWYGCAPGGKGSTTGRVAAARFAASALAWGLLLATVARQRKDRARIAK